MINPIAVTTSESHSLFNGISTTLLELEVSPELVNALHDVINLYQKIGLVKEASFHRNVDSITYNIFSGQYINDPTIAFLLWQVKITLVDKRAML